MKTIGILVPLKSSGLQRLLDALSDVLDVCFEERTFGDDAGIDAWFLHEANQETLRQIARSDRPCYVVFNDDQRVPCGESSTIEFSRHPELPQVLKGRQVKTNEVVNLMALARQTENMIVLASKAGAPVWVMQEVEGHHHHYVTLPIPELREGEPLFQYFHGNQFLQLLPFLLFLRALSEDQSWEQPLLQACFMFDDPNLHWPTYGFIDFAQVAAHAQIHNYHVCFATIPQDTWFVHKPTALLFQRYHDQISLLMHGNDHTAQELARLHSDEERNRNLRQALIRIGEFERRSGVEVAKVMVPPHGACSEDTLKKLAHLGFEAACISKGSLRHYNEHAVWLRTLGMNSSDIIEGLPVFQRFPLSGSCHNNILIAALLRQPIIARGHHYDVAEGLHLLTDVSGFINSLGTVCWADMKRVSRSHYMRRFDGKMLRIRMFTKRIEVCVPDGVNQIMVEPPLLFHEGESINLAWRLLNEGSEWKFHHPDMPIHVLPGQKLGIVSEPSTAFFVDDKSVNNFHFWPVVRRQLTEARDRMAPLLRRISISQSNRIKLRQ